MLLVKREPPTLNGGKEANMKDKITIEEARNILLESEFDHVYVDFDSNVFTFSAEYNAADDEVETTVSFVGQLKKYTKKELRQFIYSYE